MARPVTISNEQILDAAREVFLREGFTASTAVIARAAEVSEGMLFKRFGSKDDLFHAALKIPRLDLATTLEARIGQGDVRANLELAALELVSFFRELMPTVMTLWRRHAPNMKDLWQGQDDPQPLRTLRELAGYIEAEMALNRMTPSDPWVLARVLVGSTHHYVFMDQVGLQSPMEPEAFARNLVETLWRGVAPSEDS